MKNPLITTLAAALAVAAPPAAQAATTSHDATHHDTTAAAAASAATKHHAVGVVRSVDAAKSTVMIAHEPIASLGWPAMSMSFRVPDQRLLARLRAGSAVEFDFEQTSDGYVVTAIR
jgi:Cu(I)/Ag(I) efflux system periplasmic protein CusF